MSEYLRPTRLPSKAVKRVLFSGEYPQLAAALEHLGLEVILTKKDNRLPEPVAWHPDMQVCVLGEKMFVLREGNLAREHVRWGVPVEETEREPGKIYPADAICNVLAWGAYVVGNPQTADPRILQEAQQSGLNWIAVKQGYTACSTAIVDTDAVITSDPGVAAQLERHGLNVLQITPGNILLPGYQTGFLGGCCGMISSDRMAFTGSLEQYPDGQRIKEFLWNYHVSTVELSRRPMLDVGGLIAFC